MELLLLCWEFFKIGLFAVGGGMATIPFLTSLAQKYPGWMSLEELANMIAVSESTPGPIGINMATYVGYQVSGVPGAVLASLALVLPAFIIVCILARLLEKWRQSRFVNAAFAGLRPAVAGLIAAAGWVVLKIALLSGGGTVIAGAVMLAALFICTQIKPLAKLHPIAYIAAGAAAGIILKL